MFIQFAHEMQYMVEPKTNHLLCKDQYHCTADHLFDQTHKIVVPKSKPVPITRGQLYNDTYPHKVRECSLVEQYSHVVLLWNEAWIVSVS